MSEQKVQQWEERAPERRRTCPTCWHCVWECGVKTCARARESRTTTAHLVARLRGTGDAKVGRRRAVPRLVTRATARVAATCACRGYRSASAAPFRGAPAARGKRTHTATHEATTAHEAAARRKATDAGSEGDRARDSRDGRDDGRDRSDRAVDGDGSDTVNGRGGSDGRRVGARARDVTELLAVVALGARGVESAAMGVVGGSGVRQGRRDGGRGRTSTHPTRMLGHSATRWPRPPQL